MWSSTDIPLYTMEIPENRMDPSHNKERWNMFTRFCINTDIEKTFGKGVIVPDEFFNQIKFSLWFDDFSPGCGACGKLSHSFKDCPSKKSLVPTLQLKIKKPSSKPIQLGNPSLAVDNNGWNVMGKNNKVRTTPEISIPKNNLYLSDRGGINVIYESDDSDEGIKHLLKSDELNMEIPNLIPVAADLHPYNIIMDGKNKSSTTNNKGMSILELPKLNQKTEIKPTSDSSDANGSQNAVLADDFTNYNSDLAKEGNPFGFEGTITQTPTNVGNNNVNGGSSALTEISADVGFTLSTIPLQTSVNCDTLPEMAQEEEMIEFEDEQYEYEYDLLVDEPVPSNTIINHLSPREGRQPTMINDDPPFSEKDLEDFLNSDNMDGKADVFESEGTFHSTQNSINSSTSFVQRMEKLIVHQSEKSTSTSSKRKIGEGMDDTATSDTRMGKSLRSKLCQLVSCD